MVTDPTDDFVLWVVSKEGDSREAPTQKLTVPLFGKAEIVDPEKFRKAYEGLMGAIKLMCEKSQGLIADYSLEEIDLHLGVSAEAGIAFVSSAGVEADIEIKVRRRPPAAT